MVAEVNAQAAAGWKVPAIFMSFTAICMLLLMGVALLHFGDVLFSRRARGWIFRTYTQIAQEIYPETISFIVGAFWWLVSLPSPAVMISVARMFSSWCAKAVWYYRGGSVTGYVALTIDDAPGRGEPLTEEIISLLEEFDAKCTFFVVSNYMDRHEDFLEECVGKGHELANHGGDDMFALFPCPCYVPGADLACGADSPYHRHSETEFREVLLDCQRKIDTVNGTIPGVAKRRVGAPKWFRPPQGKMSAAMDRVLQSFGYSIAMCDCWGMDVLCGADFVQKYTLRHVRDGSILLVHMPEQGFRDWTLVALRGILAGLKQREIKCVTLSELHALAASSD